MHYFKFQIAQVAVALQGLLPSEQAAYMRMMMQYISDEAPLPHDLKKLARGWGLQLKDVETVCNDPDLCVSTKEGYVPILGNEFLETSLKEMRGRSNGGKQGAITRAKKRLEAQSDGVTENELSCNSVKSDIQLSCNSAHTPLVPITNNQKQRTKDQEPRTKNATPSIYEQHEAEHERQMRILAKFTPRPIVVPQ